MIIIRKPVGYFFMLNEHLKNITRFELLETYEQLVYRCM